MTTDLVPFELPEWVELKSAQAYQGGFVAEFTFPNGRGASVIQHSGSYGGTRGLSEVGALNAAGEIDKHTGLEDFEYDDVVGWLSPAEVVELMRKIADLPPER